LEYAYAEEGKYAQAEALCREGLKAKPDDPSF
jgi:hypothetical protein